MLRTSILSRFCAPLIDTLATQSNPEISGYDFLEMLWTSNYFLIALDVQGAWYRYHHLFRQLLQQQLLQEFSNEVVVADHMAASLWFESGGFVEEVVSHALKARDSERAAKIVEEHVHEPINYEEWRIVDRWINLLPQEARRRPGLLATQAMLAQNRYRVGLMPPLLDAAQEGLNGRQYGYTPQQEKSWRRKKETFRGATTDPFMISWPAKFKAKGELRHQYGHAIDMVPTVLDLLDIDPPKTIKGVKQSPFEGVSLAKTIENTDAKEEHKTQYFEMFGCRSIYHEGWRAECDWPGPDYATGAKNGHNVGDPIHKADREALEKSWQLFDLTNDPAEVNDLADQHPHKLKELIELWWYEAKKYNVLPLQGTMGQRFDYPRPMPGSSTTKYVLFPGAPVPSVVQPSVYNRSHVITAEINVPKGGVEGVIYASGAHTGGYTLFVKDGKLHFAYNYLTRKMFRISAEDKLAEGDATVVYEFEVTGKGNPRKGNGPPGTGKLSVNGKKAGEVDMDVTVPFIFSIEGISIGHDYGDSVDHDNYMPTFPFTGTVKQVTFNLDGDAVKDAEAQTRHAMSKQ